MQLLNISLDMKPAYWNPKHFSPGQHVRYGDFPSTIVRHYFEGMWEVRIPGGIACVSGASLTPDVQA